MTIIVFLIDTSASMNQRTYIGARPTLLDVAKGAVENFVKLRQRNPESRFDRYMLFTSEEIHGNIKAGWKENLATFMNELKNIRATGLSTVGPAIKNVFDVLNINRMQSGIDTYGSGRSPFFLEPSMIVFITDGGKLCSSQGVQDDIFPLPKSHSIVGADLTREIFRWDQRLFALVLRLTGTPTPETMGIVPSDNSPLDKLCEYTGGRSYAVRTHRMFQQCIDSLVQKVQSGVVINFEKTGPDPPPIAENKDASEIVDLDKENIQLNMEPQANPMFTHPNGPGCILSSNNNINPWPASPTGPQPPPMGSPLPPPTQGLSSNGISAGMNVNVNSTAWHNCRKMIYVPRPPHRGGHGCFWPIPESYYPDSSLPALPIRGAHPNLKFSCVSQEPMVIDNLPFDKYELEPSPLTQFILSRKQPTVCWQVFIANSSKNSDVGHPFGYLKASTTKMCVNLFVMPYNYPVLLPLLDDLFKTHRLKPTKEWRIQFDNYLKSMPNYYISPLKRALDRMSVSNLIPDKFDNSLSFTVVNNLKKLKNQAKLEYEKICAVVEKRVNAVPATPPTAGEGIKVQIKVHNNYLFSNHLLEDKLRHLRDQVTEYTNFTIPVKESEVHPQLYRNPFDIGRSQLIDQLTRMRANFLQQSLSNLLIDKGQDQLHCKPINQMGNYQDYLKKMNPPLREIESAPVRQHMFGNPFKIDKRMSMMVDEADVDLMGGAGNGAQGGGAAGVGGRGAKRFLSEPPSSALMNKGNKRRKGPIAPDFNLERYLSSTPPPSPGVKEEQQRPDTPIPVSVAPPLRSSQDTPVAVKQEGGVVPDTLSPSPAAITPGYLSQISPPGSPAPYPTSEDMPVYGGAGHNYPVLNGDVSAFLKDIKGDDFEEPETDYFEPLAPSPPGEDSESALIIAVDERNGVASETEIAAVITGRRVTGDDGGVLEPLPNGLDTPQTVQFNRQLVLHCYKEVKKPGRDFRKLFDKLDLIQGSLETRIRVVDDILKEAVRFKRHSLISLVSHHLRSSGHWRDTTDFEFCPDPPYVPPMNNIIINGHNR